LSDYPNKSKFIALYRAMQNDHPSAKAQYDSLTEVLKVDFENFQVDAGNAFLQLKEELDEAVENLGDMFSGPDPRKWTAEDWWEFNAGIGGHRFEEILTKYAKGENNMDAIWREVSDRL
jgi:hypothetical protein